MVSGAWIGIMVVKIAEKVNHAAAVSVVPQSVFSDFYLIRIPMRNWDANRIPVAQYMKCFDSSFFTPQKQNRTKGPFNTVKNAVPKKLSPSRRLK